MSKSITQDMAYRQSLMKYAEKYGVSRASRKYNKSRSYIYFWKKRWDTRQESDTYTDKPDGYGKKRGLLITNALQQHTGRNSHKGISDKVSRISQLRHKVTGSELTFNNDSHRILKPCHKRNHGEQCKHHYNGKCIVLFLLCTHFIRF